MKPATKSEDGKECTGFRDGQRCKERIHETEPVVFWQKDGKRVLRQARCSTGGSEPPLYTTVEIEPDLVDWVQKLGERRINALLRSIREQTKVAASLPGCDERTKD